LKKKDRKGHSVEKLLEIGEMCLWNYVIIVDYIDIFKSDHVICSSSVYCTMFRDCSAVVDCLHKQLEQPHETWGYFMSVVMQICMSVYSVHCSGVQTCS